MQNYSQDNFISLLRSYLKCPFLHQGRSRFGLDCAGLIILSFKEMGYEFEDLTNYNKRPNQDDILKTILANGFYDVNINDMKKGDMLLMSYDENIQHIAVITEENPYYIIHSVTGKSVIEHRLDDSWKQRIRRVFRFDN